jgi:hypothetical protein
LLLNRQYFGAVDTHPQGEQKLQMNYEPFLKSMGPCIVTVFLSMTKEMQPFIILFIIGSALHVSSGFSAHHQEFKSVHAATCICQTFLVLPLAWMS